MVIGSNSAIQDKHVDSNTGQRISIYVYNQTEVEEIEKNEQNTKIGG